MFSNYFLVQILATSLWIILCFAEKKNNGLRNSSKQPKTTHGNETLQLVIDELASTNIDPTSYKGICVSRNLWKEIFLYNTQSDKSYLLSSNDSISLDIKNDTSKNKKQENNEQTDKQFVQVDDKTNDVEPPGRPTDKEPSNNEKIQKNNGETLEETTNQKEGVNEQKDSESESNTIDSNADTLKDKQDTAKTEDDLNSPLPPSEPEEMLSYEEWKQKKMQETEIEKNKQLEAALNEPNGNGNIVTRPVTNNFINYAAHSCGAKILATNPEAQNPSSILTENKDNYMIQPCKADKWFIVELCEMVQLQSLEIANLELFSSLPESFLVYISDHYPSKDWKLLGTFHAREARSIQSFAVKEAVNMMFSKYLKIEMKHHFGSEHFCPLTIIRVYGSIEEEEYINTALPIRDADNSMLNTPDTEESKNATSDESPVGILHKAGEKIKDTINGVVNKVLKLDKSQELNSTYMDEVVKMNQTDNPKRNQSTKSVNEPCDDKLNASNESKVQNMTSRALNKHNVSSRVNESSTFSVPMRDILATCYKCSEINISLFCHFYHLVSVSQQSCPFDKLNSKINYVLQAVTHQLPSREDARMSNIISKSQNDDNKIDISDEVEVIDASVPIISSPTHHAHHATSVLPTPTLVTSHNIQPTASAQMLKPESCDEGICSTYSGTIIATPTATEPIPTATILTSEEKEQPDVKGPEITDDLLTGDNLPVKDATEEHKDVKKDEKAEERDIYAQPDQAEPVLESVSISGTDDLVQKYSNGRKDVTVNRLKNRIKELELNLNLSSQYLEELSKSYKRKMEEMYHSLNQTIEKLSETARSAEQRDFIQQKHISLLQEQMKNLTSDTVNLRSELEHLNWTSTAYSILPELLKFIATVVVVIMCLLLIMNHFNIGRQSPCITPPKRIRMVSGSVSMTNLTTPKEYVKGHKRHSSTDMLSAKSKDSWSTNQPRSRDDSYVRHSSESDPNVIPVIKPLSPLSFKCTPPELKNDFAKHKKKKRSNKNSRDIYDPSSVTRDPQMSNHGIICDVDSNEQTYNYYDDGISHNHTASTRVNGTGTETRDRCMGPRRKLKLNGDSGKRKNYNSSRGSPSSSYSDDDTEYCYNGIQISNPYRITNLDGSWKDWDPDKYNDGRS